MPSGLRARARRLGVRFAAAVVGVLAIAACSGVPSGGSVHVTGGAAVSSGNGFQVIPSGPFPNLTAIGIVTGYLDALVDSDNNYGIARKFLAPGTTWNTKGPNISIYSTASEVATRDGADGVTVRLARVGIVDNQGNYRIAPAALIKHFTMTRVVVPGSGPQWRISQLPPGVLLRTSDAPRALRAALLYYLNPAGTHLVPEPVIVPPDQAGLATTLISRLLGGPTRNLAPAVVSAAPTGTALIGNVPVDSGGVAEVNLAVGDQQLSATELEHLSAQIVWTLRQVPGVTAVRLLDDGAPLANSLVPRVQPIGLWETYDPDSPTVTPGLLASGPKAVVGIGRKVPFAFVGSALEDPVASPGGESVAGVRRTRTSAELYLGSSQGPLHARLSGPQLTAPAFDPEGDLLIASTAGSTSTLIEITAAGQEHHLVLPPGLPGSMISSVAISHDGTRVALVVGTGPEQGLVVGSLSVHRGVLVVSGTTTIVAPSAQVQGVGWVSATELVTTVRRGAKGRGVLQTSVDGFRRRLLSAAGLPGSPGDVAAAPGQAVVAVSDGAIWSFVGGFWQRLSTGADPSYS